MKNNKLRESIFTLLNGVFFGTLITFAALSALATAFSLHLPAVNNSFHRPVSLNELLWISIGFSFLFSILFTVKKMWILVPIFLFAYLGYEWFRGDLRDCVFDLFYIISKRYDNAYGCGVLLLKGEKPIYSNIAVAFRGFALIGTAIITWATCKRQSSYWILLFSLLCFAPCCALTNTVPAVWILFLWIFSLILFMITNYARKSDSAKSMVLCLIYIVPLAVILALLFKTTPQSEYEGKDRADSLLEKFEEFVGFSGFTSGSAGTRIQDAVDLTALDDRKEQNIPVMYITAPEKGTYYLRGQTYNTYAGTGWTTDDLNDKLPWLPGDPTGDKITIRTRFVHNMLYVPYCADPAILAEGDLLMLNGAGLKEYSYSCFTPHLSYMDAPYFTSWTALPDHTYLWAKAYLENYFSSLSVSPEFLHTDTLVSIIKELVSSSAVYDLTPDKMDQSYSDFAQWFMEKGESGYCVHFASTAAVLLRSLEIPARYVTGYLADVPANLKTTVYQKSSHAWVEYWTADGGWQILEATPPREVPEEDTVTTQEPTQTDTPTTGSSESDPSAEETIPTETASETIDITLTTAPDDIGDSQSPAIGETEFSTLWRILGKVLLILLVIAIFIGILIGQRKFRIYLWNQKVASASKKARTLLFWNRSLRYSKLLKKKPNLKLKRIAEKAKFSNHSISDVELEVFLQYFNDSQTELEKQSIFRRIYGKWILAL